MAEAGRKKRTITEIRESKKTGEKMVYMSVPDYTSAKWAETAGVDVAVVGIQAYTKDVKDGTFPDDDRSYGVDDREYEKFLGLVEKRRHQ